MVPTLCNTRNQHAAHGPPKHAAGHPALGKMTGIYPSKCMIFRPQKLLKGKLAQGVGQHKEGITLHTPSAPGKVVCIGHHIVDLGFNAHGVTECCMLQADKNKDHA